MTDAGSNPDRFRGISAEEWLDIVASRRKKGILKLFVGYAPGVGKTYSMLSEGIRRRQRGEDVVVGIAESHGRPRTAELAAQLESVPLRRLEFQGAAFGEMDLDRLLARNPQVALVDEIAHTNADGSRRPKRYITAQDRTFRRTTPNCWYSARIWSALSIAGWLFAGCVFPRANGQSMGAVQPLPLGSVLPDVSGETLSGSPIQLRSVLNGKIAIVVFSFSKGGGEDARVWNEHLDRNYSWNQSVACSTVIELQDAPRLLRGFIKSTLGREMPPYIRDRTIVTYQDEALWKQRLGVTDPGHAYVLVVGENGQIRWRSSKAFSGSEFGGLEKSVLEQLRNAGLQ